MKKLNLILTTLILFVSMSTMAQIGNFNYQAAVRDASGEIMQNESITVEFAILSGSATGTELFAETHSTTTNEQGLINLEIGAGTATNGSLGNINWSTQDHFLQVSIDGTILGTSKFNSVPYSNYSQTALNADFATNAGTATNADNATLAATATIANTGINDFRVDSIITIGHTNSQQNDIKTNTEGKLQILPNGGGTPSVTFDDDGVQGVGIGTENPTEKLEVNGAIKVTEITSTPSPNTIYGNSLPLAYLSVSPTGFVFSEYGVLSYVRNSVGNYTLTLDNSWTGDDVICLGTLADLNSTGFINTFSSLNSNTIEIRTFNASGVLTDRQINLVVYGKAQ